MNNVVTQRFIECIQSLKEAGKIKSARQFALSLDYLPQGLSEMYNNRRDVTIELLRRAIAMYDLNAGYIFTGNGPRITTDKAPDSFKVLTVITDDSNTERIVHVPVAAQAGYADQLADPVFVQDLPTYSLPDPGFQQGSYRSFDVAGDSMEPTLHNGDKVVCAFIEPGYWEQAVKDNQVFVVVTTDGVLVKRLLNNIRQDATIDLVSDNKSYVVTTLELSGIREIWRVRLRISAHLNPAVRPAELEEQMEKQSQLIEQLNSTLEMFMQDRKSA